MTVVNLVNLTVPQLVDRFAAMGVEQDNALLLDEYTSFNRLFDQMEAIKAELKSRDGDQRSALLTLFDHPNMQVRLKAAKATLAVAPDAARRMLRDGCCRPSATRSGSRRLGMRACVFGPSMKEFLFRNDGHRAPAATRPTTTPTTCCSTTSHRPSR